MEYRIVVDSCGELTDEMKKSGIYKTASLSMEVDGVHIQDDESFDQADFLKRSGKLPFTWVNSLKETGAHHRRNIWSCIIAKRSGFMP